MVKKMVMALVLMPMMALAGTIGDGLDNTSRIWTTGGNPSVSGENVNWTYNTDDSNGDGDCVVSGAGGAGDATSWLKTTVIGPCKVSFYYRFQTYGGSFTFKCDSSAFISRVGEYTSRDEPWTYEEFELGSGSHELTWEYHHPGMGFVGAFNGVHLDNFVATNQNQPTSSSPTTWYVNGSTGSDSNSGTSESSAKATIQAAIDISSAGDTILVAPGTYAPFSSHNKLITVKGISGAFQTTIDGNGEYLSQEARVRLGEEWDSDDRPAVTNTVVEGFSIQHMPNIYRGTLKRCVIRDNDTSSLGGAAFNFGVAENCLFLNNRGMNGAAADGCILKNCTLVGNSARDIDGVCVNSVLENCIVYGNDNDECSTWEYWLPKNPLVLSKQRESKVYRGNPCFVDVANGDYRLTAGSPCIDAGDNSHVTGDKDLAGNARIANGTVDIGCYEYGAATPPTPPAPTGNHGLSISYYDAGDSTTFDLLEVYNVSYEEVSYEETVAFFSSRTPDLTANTFDIGDDTLDFGYHWNSDGICRFHGKYADYSTHYFWAFMTGSVTLNETGYYKFGIRSDDGCNIFIDGQSVVNTLSCHSSHSYGEAEVYLTEGVHSIAISYNEYNGPQGLTVYMKRPSESNASPLPQSILYDGTAVTPTTTYTVTFDLNGAYGTAPAQRYVAEGAVIGTLPTPRREGYEFMGWHRGKEASSEKVTASTVVTGNLIVYAVWRVAEYTVWFDANGGTVGSSSVLRNWGTALGTLPTPTQTGYTFLGWYTTATGGTQVTALTMVTANVTYYAHWTANGGGSNDGDTPTTTPLPEVVIAGTVNDTSFLAKAQTVNGALYNWNGSIAGTIQVKIGKVSKKGIVKISGNATLLIDGKAKKVTAKAVNVELDATGRVPLVTLAFKAPIGEMAFEMATDGTFTLKNGNYVMVNKKVGGDWSKAGAKVYVAATSAALPEGTIEELLPEGEPVIPKGGKWSFDKATPVKYAKDKSTGAFNLVIDYSKGTNRSAMKLTYTPKTGIFKGSFKIYAIQDGKLKKFKVNVIGVVVDGKGAGDARGPDGLRFDVMVE